MISSTGIGSDPRHTLALMKKTLSQTPAKDNPGAVRKDMRAHLPAGYLQQLNDNTALPDKPAIPAFLQTPIEQTTAQAARQVDLINRYNQHNTDLEHGAAKLAGTQFRKIMQKAIVRDTAKMDRLISAFQDKTEVSELVALLKQQFPYAAKDMDLPENSIDYTRDKGAKQQLIVDLWNAPYRTVDSDRQVTIVGLNPHSKRDIWEKYGDTLSTFGLNPVPYGERGSEERNAYLDLFTPVKVGESLGK